MKKCLLALLYGFLFLNLTANDSVQAIILAAGRSTRWDGPTTKLCTPICNKPMVLYPIQAIDEKIIKTVVIGHQKELVKQAIINSGMERIMFAEQFKQKGTGHALLCSRDTWQKDHILVLNGDMPLITHDIVDNLITQHFTQEAEISIIIAYNIDPKNTFGRIVQDENGIAVIEKKHFTYDINDYPFVNAGLYLINRSFLENYIESIQENEQTHEFYITDLVHIASKNNFKVVTVEAPFERVHGINTREEYEQVLQIKRQEADCY